MSSCNSITPLLRSRSLLRCQLRLQLQQRASSALFLFRSFCLSLQTFRLLSFFFVLVPTKHFVASITRVVLVFDAANVCEIFCVCKKKSQSIGSFEFGTIPLFLCMCLYQSMSYSFAKLATRFLNTRRTSSGATTSRPSPI